MEVPTPTASRVRFLRHGLRVQLSPWSKVEETQEGPCKIRRKEKCQVEGCEVSHDDEGRTRSRVLDKTCSSDSMHAVTEVDQFSQGPSHDDCGQGRC